MFPPPVYFRRKAYLRSLSVGLFSENGSSHRMYAFTEGVPFFIGNLPREWRAAVLNNMTSTTITTNRKAMNNSILPHLRQMF